MDHTITYSNKGTRSEAQDGHLSFNGKEIPDVFTYVRDGNLEYKFFTRKFMWGKAGYFLVLKSDDNAKVPAMTEKAATAEELAKGWYRGRDMLGGTPPKWIYVEWSGGQAHAAPEAVWEMAESLDLKPIPRFNVPAARFEKE